MYPNREVYSQPPVVMVTAQATFIDSPRLRQPENLASLSAALQDRFPLSDQISMGMGAAAAPGQMPQMVPQFAQVLRNADATESLTVTSWSITYETTAYIEFDMFLTGLVASCHALVALNIRPALRRIGLRYINEIRVPEPMTDMRDWATWIDPVALGAMAITPDDVPVRTLQGAVSFDLGGGGGLNVGCAAIPQGGAVNPQFLVRPPVPPGPCFVVDLDGYFEVGEGVTMQLNNDVVGETLTTVHGPIGTAFQRVITDNARSLFRGGPARIAEVATGRHSL
ncbi:MAG: TIGR04255 family protein [Mycobacterium sp.]|nr:TIGR04255 family protein [Mycobacterium sp.]